MPRDPLAHDSFGIWSDDPLEDLQFSRDTIGTFASPSGVEVPGGGGNANKRRRRLVLRPREVDEDEEWLIALALLELGVF